MALVLGVQLGDVIDIGNGWICIAAVLNKETMVIVANDASRLLVSPHSEVEVKPKVWVQLPPNGTRGLLRLVIQAPKKISITRRSDPPGDRGSAITGKTEAEIMEAIIEEYDQQHAAAEETPKKDKD